MSEDKRQMSIIHLLREGNGYTTVDALVNELKEGRDMTEEAVSQLVAKQIL